MNYIKEEKEKILQELLSSNKIKPEQLIDYKYFLELYETYKDKMSEIEFAKILGISYINYKNIKNKGQRAKVLKRKEQGCVCVDMECSAMNAVAKFRNKDLFQFFYAADNLDSAKWDKRSLGNDDRLSEKEKIIYLVLDLALKMK